MKLRFVFFFIFIFCWSIQAESQALAKLDLKKFVVSGIDHPNGQLAFILHLKMNSDSPTLEEIPREGHISSVPYLIKGRSIYLGFDRSFEDLRRYSQLYSSNLSTPPFFLFIKTAEANSDCSKNELEKTIGDVNDQVNQLSLTNSLKNCHFNLKDLIQKKIKEAKETLEALGQFNLGDFIASIKKSFQALKEIAPHFNKKIIMPLQKIQEQAPRLANLMLCSFAENKIGDLMIAATIPGGAIRISTKTLHDILEFSERIGHLAGNRKALLLLIQLEKRGLLSEEVLKRISEVSNDFDGQLKRAVSNKHHGFRDHHKMLEHAEKHAKEMGFKSNEEYLEAAHNFVKRTDTNCLAANLPDGGHVKWNTKTNEYVVLTKEGQIQSYYRKTCKDESDMLLVLVTTHSDLIRKGICR